MYGLKMCVCLCLYGCVLTVHRSALNDFQRSEGRELVPRKADRATLLPGITLEECAKRCSESLDCRSHNPAISQVSLILLSKQ